jgi:hypothetical protein
MDDFLDEDADEELLLLAAAPFEPFVAAPPDMLVLDGLLKLFK